MSMRKEWFKEVDGGLSRFSKAWLDLCKHGSYEQVISRTFRTLLAEDAAAIAPTPRPFRVGDRVITNPCDSWSRYVHSMKRLFHEEGEVIEIENEYVVRVKHATGNWKWPASALELVTAVDAPANYSITIHKFKPSGKWYDEKQYPLSEADTVDGGFMDKLNELQRLHCTQDEYHYVLLPDQDFGYPRMKVGKCARVDAPEAEAVNEPNHLQMLKWINVVAAERDQAQAEVRRLEAKLAQTIDERDGHYDACNRAAEQRDSLQAQLDAANADLAAIRARVEAGKVVYGHDLCNGEWTWSYHEYHTIDTHTALLIDDADIAPELPVNVDIVRTNEHGLTYPSFDTRKGERRQSQAKGMMNYYGDRVFYRSGVGFSSPFTYKASRCTSHPRRAADRRQA